MKTHAFLVNGEFNAPISPRDRGLAYGDGVFRTLRIQSGLPSNWHLHYQKLVADCSTIGIVCPSAELLIDDIHRLFMEDVLENNNATAKIIITRGEGERGYAPPAITLPTRVVMKSAMPSYAAENYSQGVVLYLCNTRLAIQPQLAGIKHLNRLENVLARMEWRDEQVFDGLMLDANDNVTECTMSNIFARFGDALLTPPLNLCGVAGITRQQILALSKPLNLFVNEGKITLEKLYEADEVIICNSLYGVFQVRHIGDKQWQPQALAATLRSILKYDEAH
jgi:4-amino-4-deoxychorismate lyase